MPANRIWRVDRAAAVIGKIGRGDRRRPLQMMLKEPDLIDADTFRELDFFELARNISVCVARGRGRPDCESQLPPSRFRRRRAARGSQLVLSSPPPAGFVNRPLRSKGGRRPMTGRGVRIGWVVRCRRADRRHWGGHQLLGARDVGLASRAGQKPVVSDAMKPLSRTWSEKRLDLTLDQRQDYRRRRKCACSSASLERRSKR